MFRITSSRPRTSEARSRKEAPRFFDAVLALSIHSRVCQGRDAAEKGSLPQETSIRRCLQFPKRVLLSRHNAERDCDRNPQHPTRPPCRRVGISDSRVAMDHGDRVRAPLSRRVGYRCLLSRLGSLRCRFWATPPCTKPPSSQASSAPMSRADYMETVLRDVAHYACQLVAYRSGCRDLNPGNLLTPSQARYQAAPHPE